MTVTEDIEKDDKTESDIVLAEMKAADNARLKQGKTTNDKIQNNGYWLCLVFVTEDQRNEFVKNSGWNVHADSSDTYYDGIAIAKSLGVPLTPECVPFRDRGPDKMLVEKVGIIPQKERKNVRK